MILLLMLFRRVDDFHLASLIQVRRPLRLYLQRCALLSAFFICGLCVSLVSKRLKPGGETSPDFRLKGSVWIMTKLSKPKLSMLPQL
jgi:hypothetical protein